MNPVDRLRNYLLPKTLAYAAARSPFYARHWQDKWGAVKSVDDLPLLPLLTKELAVEHQEELRCGPAAATLGVTSSGTTRVGKRMLRVQHVPEEEAALAEYFQTAEGEPPKDSPHPGLVLHLPSVHHGAPRRPGPDTLQLIWAPEPNVCAMVQDVLESTHEGHRVTAMRLGVSALKQLTAYFLHHGVDFGRFAVKEIGTNAALVTSRWRRLVEGQWGARIYDNYSLSEFDTPATECATCGYYHFTAPPLAYEVVDPHSGAQVREAVGHLLLTSLVPYVQRQPLIRYATQDLVEIGPACAHNPDVGLRFRGRLSQTQWVVREGRAEYLLFPTELEDAADELPEVARHEIPLERLGVVPAGQAGQPKTRSERDGLLVRAVVAVQFEPRLFPERARAIEERLCTELLSRHPGLARAQAKLEVRLSSAAEPWFLKYTL